MRNCFCKYLDDYVQFVKPQSILAQLSYFDQAQKFLLILWSCWELFWSIIAAPGFDAIKWESNKIILPLGTLHSRNSHMAPYHESKDPIIRA